MMKIVMMMKYLRANAVDLEVSSGGECPGSEPENCSGHTFVPLAFKSALAVDSMGFPSLVVVLKMRPFFLQLMAEKNYAPL